MQYLFLYGSKCGLLENPTPCSKIDFSEGPRLSGSSSSTSGTVFHPVCLPPFSPSRSQSGFFPALLLYKMTSSVPADAASVWRLRTELKPHHQDGLQASADSDFYVLLVILVA